MSIRPALTVGTLLGAAALAVPALSTVPAVAVGTAPAPSASTVQRGFVVECTGRLSGRPVHASLYENDSAVNVVEVGIGAAGAAREVADIADLAHGGRVRAAVRLDGARARITGTLRVTGRPTRIRQEQDDAGQHIVAAGRHRAITAALRISYRGDTTRLECANAFQYRLRVTTTPTV